MCRGIRRDISKFVISSLYILNRGFSNGEYHNMFIDHDQSSEIIADKRIHAVKFVGSTIGGKIVAE